MAGTDTTTALPAGMEGARRAIAARASREISPRRRQASTSVTVNSTKLHGSAAPTSSGPQGRDVAAGGRRHQQSRKVPPQVADEVRGEEPAHALRPDGVAEGVVADEHPPDRRQDEGEVVGHGLTRPRAPRPAKDGVEGDERGGS